MSLRLWLGLIFCPIALAGQGIFYEHIIDTSAVATGINCMAFGDMTNDGMQDVVAGYAYSNSIVIYKQDSTGQYSTLQTIQNGAVGNPVDVAIADFDGNGWLDIACVSILNQKLIWYPNQNGAITSGTTLDSNYYALISVWSEDFNKDGYTDILAHDDTVIRYYQNDGLGTFTKSTVANHTEFYRIAVGDIDNDGFSDLLIGSNLLYTYLGQGNGNFIRDYRNEPLINNLIFEIELGDLDGDNDLDAVIFYHNALSKIDWYANDGTGKFSFSGTVTNSAYNVESLKLADINMDGHIDLLTAYPQSGEFVWIKNNGNGTFSGEQVIKTYSIFLTDVSASDFDLDGDVDLFCGHQNQGLFKWENMTSNLSLPQTDFSVEIFPNPSSGQFHICTSMPGHLNIISTSGKLVFEKSLEVGNHIMTSHLAGGIYSVIWQNQHGDFELQKLMIK